MIKRRTIVFDGLSSRPARWLEQCTSCQRRVSSPHLLCLVLPTVHCSSAQGSLRQGLGRGFEESTGGLKSGDSETWN
jgi:hypothetical protein